MSPAQLLWDSTPSTDRPISLVLRLSNSPLALEKAPSSVVQTGVKSFGWENKTPQLSPSHSWKLIVPSVVSAVKSGAVSPNRIAIMRSPIPWPGVRRTLPHAPDLASSSPHLTGTSGNCRLSKSSIWLALGLASAQPEGYGDETRRAMPKSPLVPPSQERSPARRERSKRHRSHGASRFSSAQGPGWAAGG